MAEYKPEEKKKVRTELDPMSADSNLSMGPAEALALAVLMSLG